MVVPYSLSSLLGCRFPPPDPDLGLLQELGYVRKIAAPLGI